MLVLRQIWFIGLVSLVSLTCLVSCGGGSDDDLLAPQPEVKVPGGNIMTPITFGGKETEETSVTRAGTPLYEKNITTFKAWGYKDMSYNEGTKTYYDNQQVMVSFTVNYRENSANTTASNTNGWEYVNQQTGAEVEQSIKYWDWDAKAYRFFAVTGWGGNSPKNLAPPAPLEPYTTYYDSSTPTEYKISMLADATSKTEMDKTPYFSHLWFSNGAPLDYPDKQFGQPVTLEFQKPYARVRFIFKYSYPRVGIELKEPSFKPTDGTKKIARKGTVTVIYPLTGSETQETFSLSDVDAGTVLTDFTEDFDPEDDGKVYTKTDKGWYMVLPNIEQGSYTMSVYINDPTKASPPKTAVVPAEFMKWFPGYSYTYVFKITEEGGIEIGGVEFAVTPWTEMEEDWTVYNW